MDILRQIEYEFNTNTYESFFFNYNSRTSINLTDSKFSVENFIFWLWKVGSLCVAENGMLIRF